MFSDRLRPTLSLTIGTATTTFPAGAIRRFEVDCRVYGFSAAVEFDVSSEQEDDPIVTAFVGRDLAQATLTLIPCTLDGTGDDPVAFPLTGYVLEKRMRETASPGVFGAPIVSRRYSIRFADPASAFWRQHRPLDLVTDASMKDVIEAHLAPGVSLTYDFQAIQDQSPMLCVALPGDGDASFYDWVVWYLDRNSAVLEFDYVKGGYRIGGDKTVQSDKTSLEPEDVLETEILGPDPYRHAVRICNPFAVAATTTAVANADAATGVSHDALFRTAIAADVDTRVRVETARLRAPLFGLRVRYQKAPPSIPSPGGKVVFSDAWSDKVYGVKSSYRVCNLRMRARAIEGDGAAEIADASGPFEIDLDMDLEIETDPTPRLPAYVAPTYPLVVEGTVVSFGGGTDDRTWYMAANKDESILQYKVTIPLWNKTVLAPFEPGLLPGHMFFPAYKAQRVLVALSFDAALIRGFLDWAADARVPNDSQGNRIALGYQNTNGTIIDHAYTDSKPAFKIERLAGADHQLIEVIDGTFRITVEELQGVTSETPTYDVSLKVEAAKDELSGSTNAAVGDLSTSFATSFGGAKGSVVGATSDVTSAVDTAESTLSGKIEQTEVALKTLVPSTAALDTVTAGIMQAKGGLAAAVQAIGFDALNASLAGAEASLTVAISEAQGKINSVEDAVRTAGTAISEPLGHLNDAITSTETTIGGRMGLLRTRLSEFQPPTGTRVAPVWNDLLAVNTAINNLGAATAATSAKLLAQLTSADTQISAPWNQLVTDATARAQRLDQGTQSITADINTQRNALDAEAQSKLTPAALTTFRTRLSNTIDSSTSQLRTVADAFKAPLNASVQQGKDGASKVGTQITALRTSVVSTTTELTSLATSLGTRYDGVQQQATSAVSTATAPLDTLIASSQASLLQPLTVARSAVKTAQTAADTSLTTVRSGVTALLGPMRTALTALDSSVRSPVAQARTTVQSLSDQLDKLVADVSTALDLVLSDGVGQVKTLITQVQTAVDAAVDVLATIQELVKGIRDKILPPLNALAPLLTQLQTIFTTAMQLLSGILTAGVSTLEAIPATGLLKALVDPAITTIESALNTVLPTITSGVQQASTQLTTAAGTVTTQVKTVTTQVTTQLGTLTTTITGQIDAVLPPITTQVTAINTQLDTLAQKLVTQVQTSEKTALQTISTNSAPVIAKVQTVVTQAQTQIDTATASTSKSATAAQTQLDAGVTQVRTQVAAAVTTIQQQISVAAAAVDTTEASLVASFGSVQTSITQQLRGLITPLQTGVDSASAKLKTLGASVDPSLATLTSTNTASAQAAQKALVTESAIDAEIARLRGAALTPFDALRTELAGQGAR